MHQLLLSFLVLVLAMPCFGQIYKYEDEQGWHFTDKPPSDKATQMLEVPKAADVSLPEDLQDHLTKKIPPHNAIEIASLGVVRVDGPYAYGSGFFISSDGHILTNRHVVRPIEPWQVEYALKKIHALEKIFQQYEKILLFRQRELRDLKATLAAQKLKIETTPVSEWTLQAYEDMSREYRFLKSEFRKEQLAYTNAKREFRNARWEFTMRSSAALTTSDFTVTLRDKTKLAAQLVSISKDWDLAMLRVDGHTTPYLKPLRRLVHEGQHVVAIGSPWADQDAMTSGIVSQLDEDQITTDAPVRVGFSGGPLLNNEGDVIGIVTSGEGPSGIFGFAIPIARAEFFYKKIEEVEAQR